MLLEKAFTECHSVMRSSLPLSPLCVNRAPPKPLKPIRQWAGFEGKIKGLETVVAKWLVACDQGKREKIRPSPVASLFSLWFSCRSIKAGNAVGLGDLLFTGDSPKMCLFKIFKKPSAVEFVFFWGNLLQEAAIIWLSAVATSYAKKWIINKV